MSHFPKSFRTLALLTLALVAATCNQTLDGLPDDRTPDGVLCTADNCTAPRACGKSGACLAPDTCASNLDCEGGKMCVQEQNGPNKVCIVGGSCGGVEAGSEEVPANLFIVLDRSCSMQGKVGTKTKWEIAVEALDTMTKAYNGRIRFGMTLFPDTAGESCDQGQISIPVAPGNEKKIQALLTAALDSADKNYPDGPCVTPIDAAMHQATKDEPALDDKMRKSFVLLITDGNQAGCNIYGGDNGNGTAEKPGTTKYITNLYKDRGVPTFVIGFGSAIDPDQMNIFANAGGVPTGDPKIAYYKAEDQKSLDVALATIGGRTLGCTLQLKDTPPNQNEIYVFFDNTTRVPRDLTHKNGWDYDPQKKQITFFGQACDDLRSGKVKDLDVVFGCDVPTPG